MQRKRKCQRWVGGGVRAKRGSSSRSALRAERERERDEGMSKTDMREGEQVRGEEKEEELDEEM